VRQRFIGSFLEASQVRVTQARLGTSTVLSSEEVAMARGWIHTVPKDGQWVNEVEEGGEISSHDTKENAEKAGREHARRDKTEHVIHNMDGTISERRSYGGDPSPPKG
jgi:hypothetical protein